MENRAAAVLRCRPFSCCDACDARQPTVMAHGYGPWLWPVTMATGHGPLPWRLAMAPGYGAWLWPVAMPTGHGPGNGHCHRYSDGHFHVAMAAATTMAVAVGIVMISSTKGSRSQIKQN